MNDLAGAHKGCAAGSIIAHARTLQTLFVFLIALLAGLLVILDQVHIAHSNLVQVVRIEFFCQVGVEVLVLHRALGVHANNGRPVWELLNLCVLWWHLVFDALVSFNLTVVQAVYETTCIGILGELCCHSFNLVLKYPNANIAF